MDRLGFATHAIVGDIASHQKTNRLNTSLIKLAGFATGIENYIDYACATYWTLGYEIARVPGVSAGYFEAWLDRTSIALSI